MTTQTSLKDFRPKFLSDLIRLGAECDGGYVVNERSVRQSRYLMSFGINDDWSFEEGFLSRNPGVAVFCFDHSVSKSVFLKKVVVLSLKFCVFVFSLNPSRARRTLSDIRYWAKIYRGFLRFLAKEHIHFYTKGISAVKTTHFITFTEAFKLMSREGIPENSVFIKMDIEQSEFRVVPDLLKFERYINGLVIEFHDLDILWDKFVELTRKIRAHFELTHIHGNNWGGLIPDSGTPRVVEVTFLKRSLIDEQCVSCEALTYPIPQLDYANNPFEKDYPLIF